MRKRTVKALLVFFVLLLIASIASFFIDFKVFSYVIYGMFSINFLVLFVLFIKRSIKRWKGEEVKESKGERIIKWIIYTIPIVIVGYLLWMNFNPFDEVIFYDIGSDELSEFLYPQSRISAPIEKEGVIYRNIIDVLIYFDILIPFNTEQVNIAIEFQANESEKKGLKIGAKDINGTWIYRDVYKEVYETEGTWSKSIVRFNTTDLNNQKGKINFIIYNPQGNKKEFPLYIKRILTELIK